MKKILNRLIPFTAAILLLSGCQDMNRPVLGDYPKDTNPVGGPLKFYVAFDGATNDPLMNAVDSIKANFAIANTTTSIDGVRGKAMQGAAGKFVSYAKPNDFVSKAGSFTISFWEKHDGQTKNNAMGNGPEYPFSFVSPSAYHWSSSNMFLLFEGNNTACAVKFVVVSGVSPDGNSSTADTWLTWEGGASIPGLLDNTWHHCAFVYDATTSGLTFYKDGVAIGTKTWAGHGPIGLVDSKVNSVRIGAGPQGNAGDTSDDWLRSSWKGGLDQFRMYGTALTAAEVAALNSGKK